jgi:hypothetical protein
MDWDPNAADGAFMIHRKHGSIIAVPGPSRVRRCGPQFVSHRASLAPGHEQETSRTGPSNLAGCPLEGVFARRLTSVDASFPARAPPSNRGQVTQTRRGRHQRKI